MKNSLLVTLLGAAASIVGCGPSAPELTLSGLDPARFQSEVEGVPTALYTLRNASGMEVCLTNQGARIVSVMVPDRDGTMRDVVHGFDNVDDYRRVSNNFGATIGRYANRIAGGRFELDGETFTLPQNDKTHTLHGGPNGWDTKVFRARQISPASVEMTHLSPDGDAGFPGRVEATVTFSLSDDGALDIKYSATTDRRTVINMTNHAYFNLSGDGSKTILNHLLTIDADLYTPTDGEAIPLGEHLPVAGTPMDFTTPKAVGRDIGMEDEQLLNGNGYDHNWVLATVGDVTRRAARLSAPTTGIVLEVFTSEPGLQVYTGNFLDGTIAGKGGTVYPRRSAICLETQHYPDTPNNPAWPSAVLEPGQTYRSECVYKFSVE